ncbi:MAG TPA: glucose-1-phosphate cytidylyltransferase, partial [Betaproteobacteria bacterium]|nr:glucose-1-phosphate cytidylyltransferase [Betaproteobacteria bacterium]
KKYIGTDEHFILTYGDGVSDIDINALVSFHKSHGKIATVTGVRPPGRFGELESDSDGQVIEFNEKPQATGGRISGGYFIFRREIFDYLPDEDGLVLEDKPLRALSADKQLMIHRHDEFWQCMDTYRDFKLLSGLWDSGKAPWKNWS